MRIGLLARKHDIPVQEILDFLEEETGEEFHANSKLYDSVELLVNEHFDLGPEQTPSEESEEIVSESEVDDQTESTDELEVETHVISDDPETPEEDIAAADGDIGLPEEKSETEPDIQSEHIDPTPPNEDEIILSDQLIEMMESEDQPADLERIKLIKAPKKELSGLKVVGKIDLPEPKKKETKKEPEDKEVVTERDLRDYRYPPKKKRKPLTEEEKEKRRLRAKKKKEEYEARQEKRRKQKEERERKARQEAHYQQTLKRTQTKKTSNQPKKQKSLPSDSKKQTEESRPKPKTVLGKFWRWLNT